MWKKFLSFPTDLKISLTFYPFLLFYMMPVAWIKSIWQARILLKGHWHKYMGFHPLNAINSLFYRTQWLNLKKFGRNRSSSLIGLGNFPLWKWFHLSYLGSFFYANAAPIITLFGTLFWALSHLVWMTQINTFWSIFLTLTLLLSSTSYAMAFARQNYQILGWMFFPLGLFFLNFTDLFGTTIVFLLMTIGGGVTQIFFGAPIVVYFSYYHSEPLILATLLPAGIFVLFRFIPLIANRSIATSLNETAKLIGITSKQVRYNREMNKVSNYSIYFLILFSVGTLLLFISTTVFPVLAIFGLIAFFINQRFVRVADEESMILLFLSLFAFHVPQAESNFLALTALWLVASPLPIFLSVQESMLNEKFGKIITNSPFDHTEIEKALEKFFVSVSKGDSVYFAFSDPKGSYNNCFDGYRHIIEMPLYLASKKEFHLFPDWYAVSQTNYLGAPNCWGRCPEKVSENMEKWRAKFSIIYQESGSDLEKKWLSHYELISTFDWKEYLPSLRGVRMWNQKLNTPKWFLLKSITPTAHKA
jgi:hypothetical protein